MKVLLNCICLLFFYLASFVLHGVVYVTEWIDRLFRKTTYFALPTKIDM